MGKSTVKSPARRPLSGASLADLIPPFAGLWLKPNAARQSCSGSERTATGILESGALSAPAFIGNSRENGASSYWLIGKENIK